MIVDSSSLLPPSFEDLLSLPILVSISAAIIGDVDLTEQERCVVNANKVYVSAELTNFVVSTICSGKDPLGTAYCIVRSPNERRGTGQVFTPIEAIAGMFKWAESQGEVARIVDPGAGTGRYVLYGLRHIPNSLGVAAETDPVVVLFLRANAIALGIASRLHIHLGDYRSMKLERIEGRTLFIGNPPYVRHHDITKEWKEWYSRGLKDLGHASSQLAGLHLHFFLKTLFLSKKGDLGCFLTASEWLDVNYGQSLRDLLINGLGGRAVYVVSPEVPIFDAMVTACITCFAPGSVDADIEFKKVDSLGDLLDLSGGHRSEKNKAKIERSWSNLVRKTEALSLDGFINLGDLFQVRRGQVTGKNSVWVTEVNKFGISDEFLVPSITDATDIIYASNNRIDDLSVLRKVISLPASLEQLDSYKRESILEFLKWAQSEGADKGYIARNRRPWWRVNMASVPQIVVTYMGRRPPVFAINSAGASLINVAHGLYPKVVLEDRVIERLVAWLNANVRRESGRIYAGGLTKFEPSEVMRLKVPSISMLG